MPRQNREEFVADLAAAKLEGFEEAVALVEKLIESGLSLRVARTALQERNDELESERVQAFKKAKATRVEEKKPAARRRRPAAESPAPVEPAVEAPPAADPPAAEPLALVEPDDAPPSPAASTELPPESIPSDPSQDDDIPF